MKSFKFGQTLYVTFPFSEYLAQFLVARDSGDHPILTLLGSSHTRDTHSNTSPIITQGERFTAEGVTFKVDDDSVLSVGQVTPQPSNG